MTDYRVILSTVLLAVFLYPVSAIAVVSRAALGEHNFNLYAQPTPANEMRLCDLSGRPVSLSAFRGRVVLLNFWKIDCPPCAMEKPILERIHRRFAGDGLAIVAVNLSDDYTRIRQYANSKGLTFTIAYDPKKAFSIRSHMLGSGMPTTFVVNSRQEAIYEVRAVPTTYVIDRHGKIVGHSTGMINWERPPFGQLLASLLERPPTVLTAQARVRPVSHQSRPSSESPDLQRNTRLIERQIPEPTTRRQVPPPAERDRVTKRTRDFLASSSQVKLEASPKPPSPAARPGRRLRSSSRRTSQTSKPAPVSREPISRSFPVRAAPASAPADSVSARRPSLPPAVRSPYGARGIPAPPAAPSATTSAGSRGSAYRPAERPMSLPQAIPYTSALPSARAFSSTPSPRSRRPAPVVPDGNGYTMARIPPNSPYQPYSRNETAGRLPSVGPVTDRNPFESFILESFEGRPSVAQRQSVGSGPTRSPQAGRSILGRITSGITNTFWGLFPSN